jgi:hypothetical protein
VANVYSVRFRTLHGFAGTDTSSIVPAGFVWVLKVVDVYYSGVPQATVRVLDNSGGTIWSNIFSATTGAQYASYRGGQVLRPGEHLGFSTDYAMDINASGYQLALP